MLFPMCSIAHLQEGMHLQSTFLKTRLHFALRQRGTTAGYQYSFGFSWNRKIILVSMLKNKKNRRGVSKDTKLPFFYSNKNPKGQEYPCFFLSLIVPVCPGVAWIIAARMWELLHTHTIPTVSGKHFWTYIADFELSVCILPL